MPDERPRVGISLCLLGERVRWDAGHKRDPYLVDTLGPWVEWVPVCPEVELGLGIPREPVRLEGSPDAPRLIAPKSGTDHTGAMAQWARRRVADLARLDLVGYVLKKDSPSCGLERVRVYPAKGVPARQGIGAFARVLREGLALLPIEEEGRLNDPGLRESFVERLFAYDRWRRMVAAGRRRGALVAFHTVHKLQVLAHSPDAYRRLGRQVATMKGRSIAEVFETYGAAFMQALAIPATRARHHNVLEHMLGWVSDAMSADERAEVLEAVREYRSGLTPLVVPLTLLRHHARRQGVDYLLGQSYLAPHPRELTLRNHA